MTGTEDEVAFIYGVASAGEDALNGIANYTYYIIPRHVAELSKWLVLRHIRTNKLKSGIFLAPIGDYRTLSIVEKGQLPKKDSAPTSSLLRPAESASKTKVRSL